MPKYIALLRLCHFATPWFIAGLLIASLRADTFARGVGSTGTRVEPTGTTAALTTPVTATLVEPNTGAVLLSLAGLGLAISRRPARRRA